MTSFPATVSSATRRYVEICDKSYQLTLGKAASRSLDVTVGDLVTCEMQKTELLVTAVSPRKNLINRSYQNKTKDIVANVGHLFIVTAVGPLLNTIFIDRIYALAFLQQIPTTIILNKVDVVENLEEAKNRLVCYSKINVPIIEISAKTNIGISDLCSVILQTGCDLVAFAGVSGVGKSSLINALIPTATVRINTVSRRTGQGKQTTSQSIAYPFTSDKPQMLLVDTPGVQSFGVSHLTELEARDAFPEFKVLAGCRFQDCKHISEPNCLVLSGLKEGTISISRYESYLGMLDEIKDNQPY